MPDFPSAPANPGTRAAPIRGLAARVAARIAAGAAIPVLAASALFSTPSQAQVPSLAVGGLPVEPLVGETFCVDLALSNTGAATGFGPYVVANSGPFLSWNSVSFVDVPVAISQIGTFDASGQLTNPITGQVITGEEGGTAWIARYPIGSVDPGNAPLEMTACGVVEVGAQINTPINVSFAPGFEYGDTSTGTNGAIEQPAVPGTVTPVVARVEKSNTAPEGERTPGPSFPFDYQWQVNISNAELIENVRLQDLLPPQVQWTGGLITVTAPGGNNCTLTDQPDPAAPGGLVGVECDSVLGSASASDIAVSVPVYVTDILDQGTSGTELITNTVDLAFDNRGTAYSDAADSQLVAKHAALQKSVAGTVLPGSTLTYSVGFQLTDYTGTPPGGQAYSIIDTLPDGMLFGGTLSLQVNGANVPITPSVVGPDGSGVTVIEWDIGAALGGTIPAGTSGELVYEADIGFNYTDGSPVQSADPLNNTADLQYSLAEGADGGDDTNAPATIVPNRTDKAVVSPDPLPNFLMPGEQVVFRLTMDVPAGSTSQVEFTDVLPRPVFDVADFDVNNDWSVPPGTIGATNPPVVSVNTGNNSITFDWGDVVTTRPESLVVDITVTVTDTPFADELFLTNLFYSTYTNSEGTVVDGLDAEPITVGAPELVITKGVIATDNPNNVFNPPVPADPSQELADSDVEGVDANDVVTYLITVENIGTQPAYEVTVTDPGVAGLSCTNPTAADVVDGNGAQIGFTGDIATGLVLTPPLADNDDIPAGGGAPFGDDTALITLRCTLDSAVEFGATLVNTASVVWKASTTAVDFFPERSDEATLVTDTPTLEKVITAVRPGYGLNPGQVHIGEVVSYELRIRLPEGSAAGSQLVDNLPRGLAFEFDTAPGNALAIAASAGVSSDQGSFTDIAANNVGFITVGSSPDGDFRRLVVGPGANDAGFGTISNSDSDNSTDEFITVGYDVRVLNTTNNNRGGLRRNEATWSWVPGAGGGRVSSNTQAPPIEIVEPVLRARKSFSPNTGDNLTTPRVRIEVSHNAGASTATALDLTLTDVLPEPMLIKDNLVTVSDCSRPPTTQGVVDGATFDIFEASWAEFDVDDSCTFEFEIEWAQSLNAGVVLQNCADLRWQSLADADQPVLPDPPQNSLGVERTGDSSDIGGSANDYARQACADFKVRDVGVRKIVIDTDQPQTDGLPAPAETEPLTIGERVTFEITTLLPETDVLQLAIKDIAPLTDVVLAIESAAISRIGDHLTLTAPAPAADFADVDGDGNFDQVTFDFGTGTIEHFPLDGVSDEKDEIAVEVIARVKNVPANSQEDVDKNVAQAIFLPGGGNSTLVTDDWNVIIVEPTLDLTKTSTVTQIEAGSAIPYSLRVAHLPSSEAPASDVVLTDTLPADVLFVPGSLQTGAVCSNPPDSLSESGGLITATWNSFPLGAVCDIDFSVVTSVTAVSGTRIDNIGELSWTSLNTQGDPDDREYQASSSWEVVVSEAGVVKELVASSVPETDSLRALTIGEEATFNITLTFPDGTSIDTVVEDFLPTTDVSLSFVSGRVLSIGSDLQIGSGLAVGDPPVECPPEAPPAVPGTDPQCLGWFFGDVVNQIDVRPDPDPADQVVLEIVAIVNDAPLNSGAPGVDKDVENTAVGRTAFSRRLDIEQFDLVEPLLEVSKFTDRNLRVGIGEAGSTELFTLVINHRNESTASALDIVLTDTLDPNMLWQGLTDSDCPGLQVQDQPAIGTSGQVTFFVPVLDLQQDACFIDFEVQMAPDTPNPGLYPNTVEATWESAPGSPESRTGTDNGLAEIILFNEAEVNKKVSATSMDDTGVIEWQPSTVDTAIGELVEFEVTVFVDEGTTEELAVVDTLEAAPGEWTLLAADIVFKGDDITTSNTGLPSISGNVITMDFGEVVNLADGVDDVDDTIVVRIIARVTNVGSNVNGNQLRNDVEGTFLNQVLPLVDFDQVDIVEPVLAVTKTFTDVTDAVASIAIDIDNTGTGPAYGQLMTDAFDEQFWVPGSLVEISVPPGYLLLESSDGAGTTTVTLGEDPRFPLDGVILPGDSLRVEFSMTLQNGGAVPVATIPNTAVSTVQSTPRDNPDTRDTSAQGEDSLLFPQYELLKEWSGPNTPAQPGDVLTYTLSLENTGAAPATDVVVTDTPDAIGEFRVGTVNTNLGTVVLGNLPGNDSVRVEVPAVAAGETLTITYQVQVPLPYPDGRTAPEQLVNQAEATSKELLPTLSDDPGTADVDDPTIVPIVADPIMSIDKDDQVALTQPGALLSYNLQVDNTGDQDATGVIVTETVPLFTTFDALASTPGWTCPNGSGPLVVCQYAIGPLAGQGGEQLVFAVRVDATVPAGVDIIENTVEVTDDGFENDPAAPVIPSTDTDTELTPLDALPLLALDKDDGGIAVVPGQSYSYTLNYANNGNQAATGVQLSETVPAFTVYSAAASAPSAWNCSGTAPGSVCTLDVGALPAGAAGSAEFGLLVDFPAAAGVDNVVNSATLSDDGLNGGAGSVDASDNTPIIAAPDLVVTKDTDTRVIRRVGEELVYTVSYSNVGNQDATGVVLQETVPVGATYLAASSDPAWSCADGDVAGTVCSLVIGDLAVGAGGDLAFALTIVEEPEDRTVENIVLIADDGSNGPDQNPGDNEFTLVTPFPPLVVPLLDNRALALLALLMMAAAGWHQRRRVAH